MAQNIDPPMMLRGPEQFVRANTAFCEATGLTAAELSSQELLEWIVPSDQSLVKSIIKSAPKDSFRVRHQTSNGNSIPLDLRVKTTPAGNVVLGRVADSDEAMHPYVTEFDEGTVSGTLETIARIVESQNANYKCSILLVDQNRFVRGAGPSLPEDITTPLMARQLAPLWGRAERPSSGTFLLSSLTYKPTLFGKNLLRLPRKPASQHVGRTHSQAAVVKCSALLRFTQHSLNHPPQINLNGSALPPL